MALLFYTIEACANYVQQAIEKSNAANVASLCPPPPPYARRPPRGHANANVLPPPQYNCKIFKFKE